MSVRVSYKKQLAFGFMLTLTFLLALEGIVRLYQYENPDCTIFKSDAEKDLNLSTKRQICQDSSNLVYDYYPSLSIKPNQNFKTIHINSLGFRGPEITQNKSENTYRIFIIGGSTAFGWESSSDNSTIAAYLQYDFDKMNLPFNVQVVNAGVPAAFSGPEVEYVKNKITQLHPDLIIVYDGFNELGENEEKIKKEKNSVTGKLIDVYQKNFSFYKTPIFLYDLLNYVSNNGYKNPISLPFDSSSIEKKASLWSDKWHEICKLGTTENFKIIITLQPFLGTGNRTLMKYEENIYSKDQITQWLVPYQSYANQLKLLNNDCAETADLRDAFDGISEPLFFDRAHVNDKGNKIIADKLFDLSLPVIKSFSK